MDYLIYQTTNIINGMIYIGSHKTTDLNDGYQGSGTHLLRAIKKHGKENFTTTVLHKYDNSTDMFKMETELVNESFIKRDDTYNLKMGGYGGRDYIHKHGLSGLPKARRIFAHLMATDPEFRRKTCRKIREGQLKRYKTHHGTFLGKAHSDETKQKMSISKKITSKGSRNSQFGTMWITDETNNKKIKKGSAIPVGWQAGRTITYA